MPPFVSDEWLGTVTLTPEDPVVAGSWGTWTLTYTVGKYGVDEGGTVRIAQRFCSDRGTPQFNAPTADHFTSIYWDTQGTAQISARFDPKAGVRPYQKCVVLNIVDGTLAPGDQVKVIFGDTSGGSPGLRAQTFRESHHRWQVLVDCFGTGLFHLLGTSPEQTIVPGEPAKLVATARAYRGSATLHVKAEDTWGNPVRDYMPSVDQRPLHGGRVQVTDTKLKLESTANSTRLNSWSVAGKTLHALWGDPHGQTEETVGTGTLEEYFAFARDWSQLDFTGHQGNDFQITDEFWKRLQDVVQQFDKPEKFVVLLGEEWSGNTTSGGDRNVYFLEGTGPLLRSSRWQVDLPPDEALDAYPLDELFARLKQLPKVQDGRMAALVVPHVGGRYADLAWHVPELEPVIEICSAWGVFEWQIEEAFRRGYKVGFSAASDGHKGRPGSSYPGAGTFGIYGGLTCAWAEQRTRSGVWDAYFGRRTVATTGKRIGLQFEVWSDAAGPVPLGGSLPYAEEVTVATRVAGTAPIDRVEFFLGTECVSRALPCIGRTAPGEGLLVVWSGARLKGRGRQVDWDGGLRIQGAKILAAEPYGFDLPGQGIIEQTPQHVAWVSSTTGDEDGVLLQLDQWSDAAELSVQLPQGLYTLPLGELDLNGAMIPLGGERMQLEFRRMPANPRPWDVTLHRTISIPRTGGPLWVRITQTDGHRAWASPVWIEPAK